MSFPRWKFPWPPSRRQAIWTVLLTAVATSVVVGVTTSALAGITLLVGFSGVLSLTLLFAPARPEVIAALRGEENASAADAEIGLVIGSEQTVRPLDIDGIVEGEEAAARETMPRAPSPRVPKGAFGGVFDLNDSTANMLSSVSGASDEELRAFIKEVHRYGEKLRAWLEQLEASRNERLRAFSAVARATENGKAPADFARMRLRFPGEFEGPERPPEVPDPPQRPEFVGRLGRIATPPTQPIRRGALSGLIPRPDEIRGVSAEYSCEDGTTVVALNIGHINQHDQRDTAEFALRAAPPGFYEIEWQISANGLTPPTKGTIKVEVRKSIPGEPITELQGALVERKSHKLD